MLDAAPSITDSAFPSEPFPCPHCGQLLGPLCRVCVACKQPIDPAQIKIQSAEVPAPHILEAQSAPATVRFPWILFLALFIFRILVFGAFEGRWGLLKTELVLGTLELISCVWVFYDAGRRGVPRPFRWALGTLLLWPIVFPWYLARRKVPRALCPFVEGIGLPIVFVVLVALSVLFVLISAPIKL
jgi:hypothetical protein